MTMFGVAIGVQPGQKTPNTAVRQRDARIGGTIVEIDGVPIRGQRIAARKHHVLDVAMAFIFTLQAQTSKNPPESGIFLAAQGRREPAPAGGGDIPILLASHQAPGGPPA